MVYYLKTYTGGSIYNYLLPYLYNVFKSSIVIVFIGLHENGCH